MFYPDCWRCQFITAILNYANGCISILDVKLYCRYTSFWNSGLTLYYIQFWNIDMTLVTNLRTRSSWRQIEIFVFNSISGSGLWQVVFVFVLSHLKVWMTGKKCCHTVTPYRLSQKKCPHISTNFTEILALFLGTHIYHRHLTAPPAKLQSRL